MQEKVNYTLAKNEMLPKKLTSFFWHFIKKQPIAFAIFFLVPLALILETNIIPYSLKMIIDVITNQQGDRTSVFVAVAPALWLGGGVWAGLIITIHLQNWWQGYVIPRFQVQVRMSVLDYLSRHSYHYFSNQMAGSLANKVNDLPRVLEIIRMILSWNGIATLSATIVALALMATINSLFTILLFCRVLLVFISLVILIVMQKKMQKIKAS